MHTCPYITLKAPSQASGTGPAWQRLSPAGHTLSCLLCLTVLNHGNRTLLSPSTPAGRSVIIITGPIPLPMLQTHRDQTVHQDSRICHCSSLSLSHCAFLSPGALSYPYQTLSLLL